MTIASSRPDDLSSVRAHRDHVKCRLAEHPYGKGSIGHLMATFLLKRLNEAVERLEAEAAPIIVFDTDTDRIIIGAAA